MKKKEKCKNRVKLCIYSNKHVQNKIVCLLGPLTYIFLKAQVYKRILYKYVRRMINIHCNVYGAECNDSWHPGF